MDYVRCVTEACASVPLPLLLLFILSTGIGISVLFYITLFIVAPIPRAPLSPEKNFRCIGPNGEISTSTPLPCWQDSYNIWKEAVRSGRKPASAGNEVEKAEIFVSLVVPAYNEEERLGIMLAEATEYLEREYGKSRTQKSDGKANGALQRTANGRKEQANGHVGRPALDSTPDLTGWEVLIVSDGSTDKTIDTALDFSRSLGPQSSASIRVVSLQKNRGKGGAVTHGMRHIRGKYAVFADADGASKFEDLGKLVRACKDIEDVDGRGVAVGSRAHLVGSEAVVKRSFLRNLLMHSFHLLLRLLTPPATAAIRDTQCGFKLFSRPSLPYIIPYMHSEGWIFDVEMLMLAESAGIKVVEVPVGWKEVKGSKLNVLWDSLGMAWGLAVLRAAWGVGVYRR